jgi:hypothetical protein
MATTPLPEEVAVLTARRRIVSIVALAVALVALAAAPAGAVTPVVGDDTYKWFYWVGPILALSFVGLMLAMGVGYYVRVLRPKWRGRQTS